MEEKKTRVLLVAFRAKDKDSSGKLTEALKKFPAWWNHDLDGTWVIRTEQSEVEVRGVLMKAVATEMPIIVWELVPKQWAASGFAPEAYNFLHKHFA